ncbi:MAG: hypothetical protein ACO37C_13145, partial [Gemmobacter sp.]
MAQRGETPAARIARAAVAAGALRPAAVLTVLAGFFVVIAAWLLPMLWHVQQVGTPMQLYDEPANAF